MRVDDVPPWFQPAFQAFGLAGFAALEALVLSIRHTSSISPRPSVAAPRIECIWHEHLPAYIASYLPPPAGQRSIWMNHPAWFMVPVHLLLRKNGVERLVLGSSGNGGRAALAEVIALLKAGASTSVAVDGPAGPAHVLKTGALDMALASGRELVAIRFEYERALRLPGWDRKFVPLPGSRVRVIESAPRRVTAASYEEDRAWLVGALGSIHP